MRFSDILMTAAARGGGGDWTPASLGSSLLAWWDAEHADRITRSGGLVSSWTDVVGGYTLTQATEAAKPTYSATSFNGQAGITADGTDDELTGAFPGSFPTGATAGEIWVVTDQQSLGADSSNNRYAVAIGNANAAGRALYRGGNGITNRLTTIVGDGAGKTSQLTTADFSGRHVIRSIADGTNIYAEVDGVRSVATACVPATTGSRVRVFANASSTAGSFYAGAHCAVLFTSLLSAPQATQMYTFLNRRL